jgi:hypothetical protein
MKSFDQVTPATQRKWMRQLGDTALGRYDIEDAKLKFISASTECVKNGETKNTKELASKRGRKTVTAYRFGGGEAAPKPRVYPFSGSVPLWRGGGLIQTAVGKGGGTGTP